MRALLPPFLALCLAGCETAQSSAPLPISPYVATAVGRIDSADEARQLAAAADGVIESVWVARGQRVSRGQKLLSVYCDPRALAVSAREADAVGAAASANTVRQGARREEIMAARAALAGAQAEAANQQQRLVCL